MLLDGILDTMSKKLIVGNWKMNPATLDEAKHIAGRVKRTAVSLKITEAVICPPFPFIAACVSRRKARNYSVGAQSVSTSEGGAHTGQVSAAMLRSIGAEYAIVGHSEERSAGDDDEIVSEKVMLTLASKMVAIVCVGESMRDDNGTYLLAIKEQIRRSLSKAPKNQADNIVIAYEPIWAIGAKEAMRPEQIHEMSLFVKKVLSDMFGGDIAMKSRVLYGGAVNFRNAPDIMSIGKVDGLLVGRESVNITGFVELLKAIDNTKVRP